jgi:hypothetical protein
MIRTYWYLLPLTVLAAAAAAGPYGTSLVVLALTLGIFFGTVSIRSPGAQDATTTHPGI